MGRRTSGSVEMFRAERALARRVGGMLSSFAELGVRKRVFTAASSARRSVSVGGEGAGAGAPVRAFMRAVRVGLQVVVQVEALLMRISICPRVSFAGGLLAWKRGG